MSRIIWRRAHPVRLPDRIDTPPHVELFAALERERFEADMSRMERELAMAVERDWEER